MVKLPRDLSGRRLREILEGIGFTFRRQKGSHMILGRDHPFALVVVPNHQSLRAGTLRRILGQAGLSVEQLRDLMGKSKP